MIDDLSIQAKKQEFKKDLFNLELSEIGIVRKYLLNGTPLIYQSNESGYFSLKDTISNQFDVSTTRITMCGSAKLGFSISPLKLWKHFNLESDIDMVIISKKLFDEFWKDLFDFNINVKARSDPDDKKFNDFKSYFFRGWLRPDLFPFAYKRKNEWFEFCKSISYNDDLNYKVTLAVYREEFFFERYHIEAIKRLRLMGEN